MRKAYLDASEDKKEIKTCAFIFSTHVAENTKPEWNNKLEMPPLCGLFKLAMCQFTPLDVNYMQSSQKMRGF